MTERAMPEDAGSVREVVQASVPESYRPLLEPFLGNTSDDHESIVVSRDRPRGAVTGVTVFGLVPGTLGAGRIRGVAVAPLARRRGVGRALLNVAIRSLELAGARLVIVELPDEPPMRFLSALLEACGFREESRAADLIRDGVAMRYMRRDLSSAA